MAVYRDRLCPVCDGSGHISRFEITENSSSSWSEVCGICKGVGIVKVAITNSERLRELSTPEDQLKFFRGFSKWAKYAGTPLRLINPEEYDEDMIEWLNKVSDESDDVIFENR